MQTLPKFHHAMDDQLMPFFGYANNLMERYIINSIFMVVYIDWLLFIELGILPQ